MSLSLSQSLSFAAVLEDCSTQLDILAHTMMVKITSEGGTEAGRDSAFEIRRLKKLHSDCQFIAQVFSKLSSELEEKQTFTTLQQVMEEEEQRKKADTIRSEEEQMLKERMKQLKRKKVELQQKREILEAGQQLERDLKVQLIERTAEIAGRKADAAARAELELQQMKLKASKAEKLLKEQLEVLREELQTKIKAKEESEKFLQNENKELEEKLQYWQGRTKELLKEKKEHLFSVQRKRTVNRDKLMEQERLVQEMKNVVLVEREREELQHHKKEEVRAAIKLQAWWRGCMVRHGLGWIKKQEGGKKSKKDGKKSKKDGKKSKKA